MPPVQFDGLRDFIVNRAGSIPVGEVFKYTGTVAVETQRPSVGTGVWAGHKLVWNRTDTDNFSMPLYLWPEDTYDYTITAANGSGLTRSNGGSYQTGSYASLATQFVGAQSAFGLHLGRSSRRETRCYANHGLALVMAIDKGRSSYAGTVDPGESFVPGYNNFGYDYAHTDDHQYLTGATTESLNQYNVTNGDTTFGGDIEMEIAADWTLRCFVTRSPKKLNLWNWIPTVFPSISSAGDAKNGTMTFGLSDYSTNWNKTAGLVYDKIVGLGWEEAGLRDAINDAAEFKVYGLAFVFLLNSFTLKVKGKVYSGGTTPNTYMLCSPLAYGPVWPASYKTCHLIGGNNDGLVRHVRTTV